LDSSRQIKNIEYRPGYRYGSDCDFTNKEDLNLWTKTLVGKAMLMIADYTLGFDMGIYKCDSILLKKHAFIEAFPIELDEFSIGIRFENVVKNNIRKIGLISADGENGCFFRLSDGAWLDYCFFKNGREQILMREKINTIYQFNLHELKFPLCFKALKIDNPSFFIESHNVEDLKANPARTEIHWLKVVGYGVINYDEYVTNGEVA